MCNVNLPSTLWPFFDDVFIKHPFSKKVFPRKVAMQ